MPKSFPFSKILSRLGVRGATAVGGGPTHKYEGYVPVLGADNKLDPSLVPIGSVGLGDVVAENVTFTTPPTADPTATNVRVALDNITKDNGLALLRSKNLTDLTDPPAAFEVIKREATTVSSGTAVGGVVGLAGSAELVAGTNTANDDSLGTLPLVVQPSELKANYLRKTDATEQTLAGPLALPHTTPTQWQATTKSYVDAAILANRSILTSKTIWVDGTNGNDVSGAAYDITKPVKTLTKAKQLADVGDTIVVYPGTYNENDLAANDVTWYFMPGAKVIYSSGGSNTLALFDLEAGKSCNILGYGEFRNQYTGSGNRFVLRVPSGSKCVFEANYVQSYKTAIYVDCGLTGFARIDIRDSLRSDDGSGGGASAAQFLSGVCTMDVGREIYSAATLYSAGLEFGDGSGTSNQGWQVVRCPRITGGANAVHFNGTLRAQVIADTCYATGGPTVIVDGGDKNILTVTGDLHTESISDHPIRVSKGRLQCINTPIYASSNQSAIHIVGSLADSIPAYVILNNCEIWGQGLLTNNAVTANLSATFRVRIVGAVQSDCPEPTQILRTGGTWDIVPYSESH